VLDVSYVATAKLHVTKTNGANFTIIYPFFGVKRKVLTVSLNVSLFACASNHCFIYKEQVFVRLSSVAFPYLTMKFCCEGII